MPDTDEKPDPSDQQYFEAQPTAESAPAQVRWKLPAGGVNLWTDRGVFSRSKVDRGTDLLARTMRLPASGEILDLGAGYGPLGLVAALRSPAAWVTLVELNERAAELARRNLELNHVTNAEVLVGDAPEVLGERTFDAVVTNPPFRVGKVAMMRLLADAIARLRPGGSLWLVAQTRQGAKTLARDLGAFLPQIETVEISGGYRVIRGSRES
jgi:16S rRNA (guanine1207-N2)-methyltransferase